MTFRAITPAEANSSSSPILPIFVLLPPLLQYDGVSITSRLVVNGRRFGGCYNFTGMEENNYPAYFTSRFEDGQVVRGDEGISVMSLNLVSDAHHD